MLENIKKEISYIAHDYYVDAEKHVRLSESAILCKFKGERLVS